MVVVVWQDRWRGEKEGDSSPGKEGSSKLQLMSVRQVWFMHSLLLSLYSLKYVLFSPYHEINNIKHYQA